MSIVFSFSWELKWPQRETENNPYAKFWGDKQRALWYVVVFSGVVNWSNVVHMPLDSFFFFFNPFPFSSLYRCKTKSYGKVRLFL